MASQRTKFSVGLFVAGGVCIALVAVIWLGMSRFLEKGQFYVTYFNESVQGLNKDSPVKYRGVSIGRVDSISVAPDSKLIQVVLKIETGQTLGSNMVAQLRAVGITGAVFVELDQKQEGEPDRSPALSFPSEYPIVASEPSEMIMLLQGLDELMRRIRSLDLQGISDKLKLTLDNVNQVLADANVKGISANIQSSLESVNGILDRERWDKILASVDESVQSLNILFTKAGSSLGYMDKALLRVEGLVADNEKTLTGAIEEFRQAMENANTLLEEGSSLVTGADDTLYRLKRRLLVSAQNLEKATDNLNQLMEFLSDQPSQFILGGPPVPRKVEPEG